jgi:hypothetical protein
MAIGDITLSQQVKANRPRFVDRIAFLGEASYAAGGSLFATLFAAKVGDGREIINVTAGDCGGYVPVFVKSTGRLKVYWANNDGGADGPLIEVADGTVLSGVTFNLVVESF